MSDYALVLVIGTPLVALALHGRRQRRRRQAAATTVALSVDGWGVRRRLADGRAEEVAWDEVQEVELVTLPPGPWPERSRYIIAGEGMRGCIVPESLAFEHRLVEALARLPDFDHRRLAEVLAAEEPGRHHLWTRAPRTST